MLIMTLNAFLIISARKILNFMRFLQTRDIPTSGPTDIPSYRDADASKNMDEEIDSQRGGGSRFEQNLETDVGSNSARAHLDRFFLVIGTYLRVLCPLSPSVNLSLLFPPFFGCSFISPSLSS